jgi:hypothetical protein
MTVQDIGRPFACNIVIDGISNVFDLPVESISQTANPPIVILNGTVITTTFTIDYKYGVLYFATPPQPPQGTLAIQGWTYDFFDDDEVAQAVSDAFAMHTADYEPSFYIDPVPGQTGIPTVEEILVAYLAAVELLWFRSTDAAQEVDVHTPEGVLIPRSQRYQQTIQQIERLQAQYQTQCAALGVGLWRIQILNQRRISYTTNRLVPIFRDQEYNMPYTGFYPTAANIGSLVTVYGYNFTGATAVTFGGVPSLSFTVTPGQPGTPEQPPQPDQIVATVPVGAITGQVGVTTPYGVVLSTAQFVVGQPAPFILYGPEQVQIPIPPGQ